MDTGYPNRPRQQDVGGQGWFSIVGTDRQADIR